MKQIIKLISLLMILQPIFLSGCADEIIQEKETIRPVRYQAAVSSGGERIRVFSGTAKSAMESNLSFKVGGTISRITVKIGDIVETNQLIATLDNKDYNLTVQEAEAGLQQAKAQALNAASNYSRIRKLYEKDNVSKSDLDNSRAAYDSANAFVRSIKTKLELAKSRLGYTILSAPFSGAVTAVHVDENENTAAGHPIVSMASETKPEVSVAIPGILISKIKEGNSVSVTFDAVPDKSFTGIITEVGVAASRFATTYPVTISIDAKNEFIRPGMAAHVKFIFESSRKSNILVPSHAIGEDKDGKFAFILIPEKENIGTVRRISVKTGELVSEGLEVVEGLSENDLVVTAGISKLKTGMKVRLLSSGM